MDATFLADARAGRCSRTEAGRGAVQRRPAPPAPLRVRTSRATRDSQAFRRQIGAAGEIRALGRRAGYGVDQASTRLPPADGLPHAGLEASLYHVDGGSVVLVTMPHPEHGAEAYFATIVLAGDRLSDYFVLEHGCTIRDEPRIVLCKWDDRGHVNLGDRPPAEVNTFLSAVQAQLRPNDA